MRPIGYGYGSGYGNGNGDGYGDGNGRGNGTVARRQHKNATTIRSKDDEQY